MLFPARRQPGFGLLALACALAWPASGSAAEAMRVGEAVLEPVAFAALSGFAGDDHEAALATFRLTCRTMPRAPGPIDKASLAVSRTLPSRDLSADLAAACATARHVPAGQARRYFENAFSAYRVTRPARTVESERKAGFLTGYYEPELHGSLTAAPGYPTPVLAKPDDLVSFDPGGTPAGLDPALRAARRTAAGYEPYPDRAAIEDGVLGDKAKPLVYLRDAVDLFMLQVQGSGRVRLTDGRSLRLLYAGRNGHPFSMIGKRIVQEGHLPLEGLTTQKMTAWLREHPGEARRLMRLNASYIFFRTDEIADPKLGPPGAAGVPLTAGRSLAVDASLWRYGLPFWLDGALASDTLDAPEATAGGRLVVAQDTGSAITGPARGDLYLGTGDEAGIAAGSIRHAVAFVVLLPRPARENAGRLPLGEPAVTASP